MHVGEYVCVFVMCLEHVFVMCLCVCVRACECVCVSVYFGYVRVSILWKLCARGKPRE